MAQVMKHSFNGHRKQEQMGQMDIFDFIGGMQ